VVVAALGLPGPAVADRTLDSYCSPTGDYCTGIVKEGGGTKLRIDTFSLRGEYEVCVKPPRHPQECGSFRLRHKGHGLYGSRIDWIHQFEYWGKGRYTVRWRYEGNGLGRALHWSPG
jgi:hypothetical protein